MSRSEFSAVVPDSILNRYRVVSHDAENDEILVGLGETSLGTPVWTNSRYYQSDLKIVVGNIAPHQFMGFSGGVKTAAIGLAGLKTIRYNHAFMTHPDARLGVYDRNPARQDVEEIGKKLGIHLALNAVLNQDKQIVYALSGDPQAVMVEGISLARRICQVEVPGKYDLMIASPGGHPKDINVYQSQKGIFHASQVTRPGGTMILTAACPEGSGSTHYEEWVTGKGSHADVLHDFQAGGFRMGPHKAFLIARDAKKLRLLFYSAMDKRTAKNLLLDPVDDFQTAVDQAIAALKPGDRVGIMPYASSTIPFVNQDHQEQPER
jgi:nickel-dependent lactate racemase